MNAITRRLLVAAVRKLLPDALPDHPGSALARRSPAKLLHPEQSFPTARPITLYAPPPAPMQPVGEPPPRRRRRKVVVTETYVVRKEW